jgi:outer membrane lipoprotein-sorting protein
MLQLLFTALFALLAALPAYALDGTDILKKVDRHLEPASYESFRKLINIEPNGSEKDYVLFTAKKGRDKILAMFLSPASEKGRSTLRLGDNMWLYVPEVGRPIRINSMQSVIGGIFNNADILRLDYSVEYHAETIAEAPGDQYLLSLQAVNSSVAYDRLKMWVDKAKLLPTKIECYTATGLLIKTLHFSDIKDFGDGIVRPAMVMTDSPLHKGYKSVMLYSGVKARTFPDEVFTLDFMPRAGTLLPQR